MLELPQTQALKVELIILVFSVALLLSLIIFTKSQSVSSVSQPITDHRAVSMKEITHGDTTKKQVIFTFDGGAGTDSLDKILSVLNKYRVKGTFFLTGKFVLSNPEAVRKIAVAGHEIFSHTFDHRQLTGLSDDNIAREFSSTAAALESVANISPMPYFRAPYGDRNGHVLADAFRDGYQSVYWSVDAGDWEVPNGKLTADDVKHRIMYNLAPGNIYLMHLGDPVTGQVLDDVFSKIEAKGYRIVSLKEGL